VKEGAAPASAEGYTVVFLGDKRPVLLRLHIHLDGKPITSAHNEYAKKWFDFLDRNGDGVLSREEAQYVPSLQALQQMRANGALFPGRLNPASMAELDTNGDGKVSLEELTRYFDRAGFRPVLLVGADPGMTPFRGPSEALFRHLDVKNEGKLSKESVRKAAETLLAKLDTNDDEILSADELDPQPNDLINVRLVEQLRGPMDRPAASSFYLARSRQADAQLGQLLLTHYDKNKDLKLSRTESGLDPKTFDRLDANKDGLLDADELAQWHRGQPDLSITIRLGRKGPVPSAVEARQGAAQPGVDSKVTDDVLKLTLGDAQVSLRAGSSTDLSARLSTSQIYLQQFRLADSGSKGFLTEADLGAGGGRVFAGVFPLIDRDGDGKMTLAEVTAFANLVGEAGQGSIAISVAEQGRALFQLLDTDRDGRLSLRELRSAWQRLAPLDKNGDGFISADEIPRQFEVTVSQGPVSGRGIRTLSVAGRLVARPPVQPVALRGPLWFRKMDLNGDGDVSRREFLGTSAEFRRIDTDGDGLISVEEAEAYDAKLRAAQRPQR